MRQLRAFALLLIVGWMGTASADLLPTQAYTTMTKIDTSTTAQSATTLWTPTTGYRFVLQGCLVSSQRALKVRFQVSSVDVIPPIYLESYGSQMVGGTYAPIYTSAVDAVLTYTTTTESTSYGSVSVSCWGYEITP